MADVADHNHINELEQLRARMEIRAEWPYNRHPLLSQDGKPVTSQVIKNDGNSENFVIWLEKDAQGEFKNYVLMNAQALESEYNSREDAKPDAGKTEAITHVHTGEMVYRNINLSPDNPRYEIPANTMETVYFKPDTGVIVGSENGPDDSAKEAYHHYWSGKDGGSPKDDIKVTPADAQIIKLRHEAERARTLKNDNIDIGPDPISKEGQGKLYQVKSATVPAALAQDGHVSKSDLAQGAGRDYELTERINVVHSADSLLKAQAEPVLAAYVTDGMKVIGNPQSSLGLSHDYIISEPRITFSGLSEAEPQAPSAVAAQSFAAQQPLSADEKLRADKAWLEIRKNMDKNTSADPQELLEKSSAKWKLTHNAKAHVTMMLEQKLAGAQTPSPIASDFNRNAAGQSPEELAARLRDQAAQTRETAAAMPDEREALNNAVQAYVNGTKKSEILDVVKGQTPEIQARAREIAARIDVLSPETLDGLAQDVADRLGVDPSRVNADDVRGKAHSIAAENLRAATTPQAMDEAISKIDMNAIYHRAAEKSLRGLDKTLSETPTRAEALGMAADAMKGMAGQIEAMQAQQQREIEAFKNMAPDALKEACADPLKLPVHLVETCFAPPKM